MHEPRSTRTRALARATAMACGAALVACGAVLAACGSSSSNGPGAGTADAGTPGKRPVSSTPLAAGDICATYTSDLCTALMSCAQAPYRDMAQCLSETDCYGVPDFQAAIDAGAIVYDPAAGGQCAAEFGADPCGFAFFLGVPSIFAVFSSCPGTITPKVTQGGSCVSDTECVSGLYCAKTNGACPGACTPIPTIGEPCTYECAPGAFCDITGSGASPTGTCTAELKEGDACVDGGCSFELCISIGAGAPPCVSLWCDTSSNTCKAAVGQGEACSPVGAGALCGSGLWCDGLDGAEGHCRAIGTNVGDPCSDSTDCGSGLHCAGAAVFVNPPTLGACAGPVAPGGACALSTDCAPTYHCDATQVCVAANPLGGTCSQDGDCQSSLVCAGQVCSSKAFPGDACGTTGTTGTATVCEESLCKNGSCQAYAKVGQPCTTGAECATGACSSAGVCLDVSVCAAP